MCTVGFGDISPVNNVEIFVSVITILLSCGVFAYAINLIGIISQDSQAEERKTKQKLHIM